jgi:hypothetical protein
MKKNTLFYALSVVTLLVLSTTLLFIACNKDDTTTTTNPYTASDCSSKTGIEKVVCLSNNFLASLSGSQAASAVNTLNLTNAKKWSNLPDGAVGRLGIKFGALSATQLAAAKELLAAVMGSSTDDGYNEFLQINAADDQIATVNTDTKVTYSSGEYVIGFLGTPSTTGKWMLQLGGHHYAANITYDNGAVVSVTPTHVGLEPLTYTVNGVTYAPLTKERTAMAEMLASCTTAELASAKTTATFNDCLMVPGTTSNTFPATKLGVKVGSLSTAAQAKVLAAMKPWLDDINATSAAAFTTLYSNELANTYVVYSGSANGKSGDSSSFLTANTDYVRIDGPSVWIEFIVQTGVTFKTQIHYHTVYRDHNKDYIGL